MIVYTVVRVDTQEVDGDEEQLKVLCFNYLNHTMDSVFAAPPAIFTARNDAQLLADLLAKEYPNEVYEVLTSEVVPTLPEPTL